MPVVDVTQHFHDVSDVSESMKGLSLDLGPSKTWLRPTAISQRGESQDSARPETSAASTVERLLADGPLPAQISALAAVNHLQTWLDNNLIHPQRQKAVTRLLDLASLHDGEFHIPNALFIQGVEIKNDDVIVSGSFADVYRGVHLGQDVAIKRPRMVSMSPGRQDKRYKRFYREALMWRQLRHPRILTFLGIDQHGLEATGLMSIVSPWIAQGTLMDYLQKAKLQGIHVDHQALIMDISLGIQYLHNQSIAHGDLHGSNIYIDETGRALLGDFGLTAVADPLHTAATTTTINKAGAIRWLAPELVYLGEGPPPSKTISGDIFALGRLCLSVYTRRVPFHFIPIEGIVIKVLTFTDPPRPKQDETHLTQIPDRLWNFMLWCWKRDPTARPSISNVFHMLERNAQPVSSAVAGISRSLSASGYVRMPIEAGDSMQPQNFDPASEHAMHQLKRKSHSTGTSPRLATQTQINVELLSPLPHASSATWIPLPEIESETDHLNKPRPLRDPSPPLLASSSQRRVRFLASPTFIDSGKTSQWQLSNTRVQALFSAATSQILPHSSAPASSHNREQSAGERITPSALNFSSVSANIESNFENTLWEVRYLDEEWPSAAHIFEGMKFTPAESGPRLRPDERARLPELRDAVRRCKSIEEMRRFVTGASRWVRSDWTTISPRKMVEVLQHQLAQNPAMKHRLQNSLGSELSVMRRHEEILSSLELVPWRKELRLALIHWDDGLSPYAFAHKTEW